MLVTFCSKTVADMIGHGIYDTHIAIRGTPFLEAHDQPGFAEHGFLAEDKLKVGEVMTESLATLRPRMLVRDLIAALKVCFFPRGKRRELGGRREVSERQAFARFLFTRSVPICRPMRTAPTPSPRRRWSPGRRSSCSVSSCARSC